MSNFIPKMTHQNEAIQMLIAVNVPVEKREYGFRIIIPKGDGEDEKYIQCATEHDGSIGIVVDKFPDKGVEWFFRFDFIEAADFIIESFQILNSDFTLQDVVRAMKSVDSNYDDEELDKRLEQQELDFDLYIKESDNV